MVRLGLGVLGVSALVAAGCASGPVVRAEKAVASALVSPEEERQLGARLHQQLEAEGLRYLRDPEVQRYVEGLAAPVLGLAAREFPASDYHVHVVDAPDQVNAFATPGGHLYLYSGLLLNVQDESQLAGVIAHEAGHVVGRHAARNLVQALGLNAVASLALGEDPSRLAEVATQVVGTGALLHHSRTQEIEADEYGARFSHGAGYDPRGLIGFFRVLSELQGRTPRVLAWLSTHPTSEARIENLEEYIADQGLVGGRSGLGRLPEIQQRLRARVSSR